MQVKLAIVHGQLRNPQGESAGLEVDVTQPTFLIGSGADCNMRCRSAAVSPHHCQIVVREDGVLVRDLNSETGTIVNGQRIEGEQALRPGDHLQIGRLEFQVSMDRGVERAKSSSARPLRRKADLVGETISEMLVEADQEDRAVRMSDPEMRLFHLDREGSPESEESPDAQEKEEKQKKRQRPPKKPPGKLPPRPKFTADNTTEAAEETLKKIFKRPRK